MNQGVFLEGRGSTLDVPTGGVFFCHLWWKIDRPPGSEGILFRRVANFLTKGGRKDPPCVPKQFDFQAFGAFCFLGSLPRPRPAPPPTPRGVFRPHQPRLVFMGAGRGFEMLQLEAPLVLGTLRPLRVDSGADISHFAFKFLAVPSESSGSTSVFQAVVVVSRLSRVVGFPYFAPPTPRKQQQTAHIFQQFEPRIRKKATAQISISRPGHLLLPLEPHASRPQADRKPTAGRPGETSKTTPSHLAVGQNRFGIPFWLVGE